MKKFILLAVVVGLSSVSALASSANGISWSCSTTQNFEVTTVFIQNGVASVTGFSKIAEHMPMMLGGPFKNLEAFSNGEFLGVRSLDGNFSFIAGTLTFKSNSGSTMTVQNLLCKNI